MHGRWIGDLAGARFDVAHGKLPSDDLLRELELAALILDGEQGAGMSRRDVPAFDKLAEAAGRPSTQRIRDARSILSDGLGNLGLSQAEFVDQALVALRLFEGVQVARAGDSPRARG